MLACDSFSISIMVKISFDEGLSFEEGLKRKDIWLTLILHSR